MLDTSIGHAAWWRSKACWNADQHEVMAIIWRKDTGSHASSCLMVVVVQVLHCMVVVLVVLLLHCD